MSAACPSERSQDEESASTVSPFPWIRITASPDRAAEPGVLMKHHSTPTRERSVSAARSGGALIVSARTQRIEQRMAFGGRLMLLCVAPLFSRGWDHDDLRRHTAPVLEPRAAGCSR